MHQNHTQTHQAHCQSVWECPQWTRYHSCVGVRGPAVCSPSAGTTAPPLWSLGEWGPAGEVSGPTHPGWHALLPLLAEATKGPTRCKNKTQKPAKLSITYHFRLQTLGVCTYGHLQSPHLPGYLSLFSNNWCALSFMPSSEVNQRPVDINIHLDGLVW